MALREREFVITTGAGERLYALSIFFLVLATVAVIGRFICRRLKRVRPGIDDWLMAVSLIFFYAQGSCTLLMAFLGGVGHHKEDLKKKDAEMIFKLLTVVQFPYGVTMTLIRCSICMLLVRVFFTRTFRFAAYGVMSLSIAWGFFVVIAGAALCTPFEFNWNKSLRHGECGNQDVIYVAIAAWAIVCDSFLFLLPIPMVWKLQLPRVHKIALSTVFALGILDVVVSIFRIISLLKIDFEADLSYTLVDTDIWSMAEPSIAILVGCGPILRPLLEKVPASFLHWTKKLTSLKYTSSKSRTADTENYGRIDDDNFELLPGQVSTTAEGQTSIVTVGGEAANEPSQQPIRGQQSKGEINVQREYTVQRGG